MQRKAVVYDRQGDAHYDVISAFIKSIRGSDPDAALFWLARMLEAGEDARFIARRMIVHASEDIGLADPRALLIASAAAHAVEHVGLPEARLNLAEAAIYLARAPKSNSVYTALAKAMEDARERRPGAGAPAGLVVSGCQAARSREGVQVPARLPRPPGGAGVPAGQVPGERRTTSRRARARTRSPGGVGTAVVGMLRGDFRHPTIDHEEGTGPWRLSHSAAATPR